MKQTVRPDGQPAMTRFECVEHLAGMTFVRALPRTGRQHQIRVHLQSIGHPIVCDKLYGVRDVLRLVDLRLIVEDEEDRVLLNRQALHAHRVTLIHPSSGEPITFEAGLPEDMKAVVEAGRIRHAAR
jgi:23S rRNA pseudouridine1911/1915/1917 synthase